MQAAQIVEDSPAPVSTLPYPPLHLGKKFVVLSDWLVLALVRPRPPSPFPLHFRIND